MKLYNLEDLKLILNNISILLGFSAFLYLIPIFVALIYKEPLNNILIFLILGIIAYLFSKLLKFNVKITGNLSHAIVTTGFFWIFFNLFASLPFIYIEKISFTDAFFETVSATTTTGLTMLKSQTLTSYSILFWRAFLGWIGGLGIITLAIIGVFLSYKKIRFLAEAEGRDNILQSNIKKTIKILWLIYIIFTLLGVFFLRLSGMPLFDSFAYAFTAISTTGNDVLDAGLLYYGFWPLVITLILMLLGAISFVTHYLVFYKRRFKELFYDVEFKTLIFLILMIFGLFALKSVKLFNFMNFYHIVSAATCGGIALIPSFLNNSEFFKISFIFLMFIGGSTASTAGGIKIERFLIIIKMIWWKTKEIILPKNAYFVKKFQNKILFDNELRDIFSFVLLYLFFILLGTLVLVYSGYSFIDSLFEVTSAQSNVGLSVGIANSALNIFAKWTLILNMLIGRLEIIPIFAIIGFFINFKYR